MVTIPRLANKPLIGYMGCSVARAVERCHASTIEERVLSMIEAGGGASKFEPWQVDALVRVAIGDHMNSIVKAKGVYRPNNLNPYEVERLVDSITLRVMVTRKGERVGVDNSKKAVLNAIAVNFEYFAKESLHYNSAGYFERMKRGILGLAKSFLEDEKERPSSDLVSYRDIEVEVLGLANFMRGSVTYEDE